MPQLFIVYQFVGRLFSFIQPGRIFIPSGPIRSFFARTSSRIHLEDTSVGPPPLELMNPAPVLTFDPISPIDDDV